MRNGHDPEAFARKVATSAQLYARDLLAENERLRAQLDAAGEEKQGLEARLAALGEVIDQRDAMARLLRTLEAERDALAEQVALVRLEIERYRAEKADLQRRIEGMREESLVFTERYLEVERQSNDLANLYVASYRLHGTLDRAEVLTAIHEILANLVGCEEIALFETQERGQGLSLVTSAGVDPAALRHIAVGQGVIGRCVAEGETWIGPASDGSGLRPEERGLTACVPLRLDGRVVGALALFRLLPQKPGLEAVDHELFELLATHAATALHAAGLHEARRAAAEH